MLSMDSLVHDRCPSPDAVEFVRFCYRRRRTGWPELYDEMCAVAHRGLYRGWGNDELSAEGIGFSLFELPALAALVGRIVAEETEQRTAPVPAKVARADAVLQRAEQDDCSADSNQDSHAFTPLRLVPCSPRPQAGL